ncbi:phytanoyl-CoA dioxygenase family protein [Actinospica sp. MGRD01-02]|uniref:Phytanoyl-CoA dioxygenase family protein n=1 Tax=Actinospica acidithermotolerans TaxID=2828514 RepID=A0A941E5I8_9ACTN|nr:phytanoyl-CoA dioxygenase family protein [Actinospica acidithermotolerans]MBR7825496.1 phytanoyl-CoA dioxygenase family protein [Actinospica acidithermotolerans]
MTDFAADGFVKIEQAFSEETAAAARASLWRETGCDPDDPSTWTKPVIRLSGYGGGPFEEAPNTPALLRAYDDLAGPGRWSPRTGLGTFPIRFPSAEPPGDDGWHIDASFAGDDPSDDPLDPMSWRVNLTSRGRALLMLFLFSEVGENDAPTRIRVGSHLAVPRLLESAGEAGLPMREISQRAAAATQDLPVALATGRPGDVYLCHPFLVHAAQPHRGTRPRFLAQPPLDPGPTPYSVDGDSPVERAIRLGLRR